MSPDGAYTQINFGRIFDRVPIVLAVATNTAVGITYDVENVTTANFTIHGFYGGQSQISCAWLAIANNNLAK